MTDLAVTVGIEVSGEPADISIALTIINNHLEGIGRSLKAREGIEARIAVTTSTSSGCREILNTRKF